MVAPKWISKIADGVRTSRHTRNMNGAIAHCNVRQAVTGDNQPNVYPCHRQSHVGRLHQSACRNSGTKRISTLVAHQSTQRATLGVHIDFDMPLNISGAAAHVAKVVTDTRSLLL